MPRDWVFQGRYRWLVIILSFAFALRVINLDAAALRGDEAFAASYWAGLPLGQSISQIATIEPHPPLTYAVFRLWGLLVGTDSEFALRMLPALGSMLSVAGIYALGARLFGREVGLLSALLLAVSPYFLWHSRDFRNYAPWVSVSFLVMYLGWLAVQRPSLRSFASYSFVASVASLFFYFDLLFSAAIAVFGLFFLSGAWRLRWVFINAFIAAVSVGVFLYLQGGLFAGGGYAGNTFLFSFSSLLIDFPRVFLFGEGAVFALGLAAAVLCLIVFSYAFSRFRFKSFFFLLCLLIVPLSLLSVVSLRVAVFQSRYVLPVLLPLFLLVSAFVSAAFASASRLVRVLGFFVIFSSLTLASIFLNDYEKSPDWRAVRDYLAARVASHDIVIQTTVDAAFGYYVDPLVDTAAIPASPAQTRDDIDALMSSLDQQYFTIWLFEHSFYDWPNRRAAREWLNANRTLMDETLVMGVPLARYLPKAVRPQELPPAQSFPTEVGAVLYGYHVEHVADELRVWLYWSQIPDAPLAASVQLIGDWNPALNNPIWAQSDRRLNFGEATLQRDVHMLRLGSVPEGSYKLILKLYEPESGQTYAIADNFEFLLDDVEVEH